MKQLYVMLALVAAGVVFDVLVLLGREESLARLADLRNEQGRAQARD